MLSLSQMNGLSFITWRERIHTTTRKEKRGREREMESRRGRERERDSERGRERERERGREGGYIGRERVRK